nr:sensor histidine kinase [uncultured Friedmanniella sp.]
MSGLERWLHVSFAVLTLASVLRYLQNHRFDDRAGWVLAGAGLLLVGYAGYGRVPWRRSRWWPPVWCATLVLAWGALVAAAPSFSWCAVPLAFVALRVLPFPVAVGVVAVMVVTVAAAWTSMRSDLDPTVLAGPACVAVLAVTAYGALEKQARIRQRLLEDLREAQGELAEAQHRAGAAAERARLSRDIHDSVAQGLSSINLLLQAAEQDWDTRPDPARRHVEQAARTARHGLDEVRRVVRDLAAPELADDVDGVTLPEALREVAARATRPGGLVVDVAVHGDAVRLPGDVATALLRTARGALANVAEHAHASHATVTLTYQETSVSLDVLDDGCGFDPAALPTTRGDRGRGLAGIRERITALGGQVAVESVPGEGAALAASVPLRSSGGQP